MTSKGHPFRDAGKRHSRSWLALLFVVACSGRVTVAAAENAPFHAQPGTVRAVRFATNPIIKPGMPNLPGEDINGPSLIRVPSWVNEPLGKYYLYFADHHGQYIRMAFADHLEGPWTIYAPGVLQKTQTVCTTHIASPDAHVDEARHEILMYFHGQTMNSGQLSFLSHSKNGLSFTAESRPLGPSYFAVFQYGGWFYTITKKSGAGNVYRSKDGATPFTEGPALIPRMRHSAVKVDGDTLWLFFSKIGDAPESIEVVRIDLTKDWQQWPSALSHPKVLLKPEKDYEGIGIPIAPSISGEAKGAENALRDPGIFGEDGRTYLIYSVAGERGLGMAELLFN